MRHWFVTIHRTPKRSTVGDDLARRVLAEHTAYFKQLGRQGQCLLAGPFAEQNADELGAGFYVLACTTEEEARQLADRDPLVEQGLYDYRLREWIKVVPE